MDGSGEGLLYRGPFVYRKGSGNSSLTLESATFGGGLLTPSGAMFYVTDYLGSVRAVVDGQTNNSKAIKRGEKQVQSYREDYKQYIPKSNGNIILTYTTNRL